MFVTYAASFVKFILGVPLESAGVLKHCLYRKGQSIAVRRRKPVYSNNNGHRYPLYTSSEVERTQILWNISCKYFRQTAISVHNK